MSGTTRPRIAILGRFAEGTTVTRYAALVNARRLLELVWAAGGEPITLLPVAGSNWAERLEGMHGVLMPGGSDVNPKLYGEEPNTNEIYGVDDLQDEVDVSLVKYVFETGLPLLTICRGTQLTNVALGGNLLQHMDEPHRHHVAPVTFESNASELGLANPTAQASCYHHQILQKLGTGVTPIARSVEGYVEAVRYETAKNWAFGLQWHPEDNFDEDSAQLEIVKAFVNAARG
jgi:putative glutamine amidotransferase